MLNYGAAMVAPESQLGQTSAVIVGMCLSSRCRPMVRGEKGGYLSDMVVKAGLCVNFWSNCVHVGQKPSEVV